MRNGSQAPLVIVIALAALAVASLGIDPGRPMVADLDLPHGTASD